jgi:hypothetical protein
MTVRYLSLLFFFDTSCVLFFHHALSLKIFVLHICLVGTWAMGTVQYDGPMRYTFKAKENRIMNVIWDGFVSVSACLPVLASKP